MACLSSASILEDIKKKWVDSWIAKDVSFFRDGIHLLPDKWEKVMAIDNILNDQFVIIFLQ